MLGKVPERILAQGNRNNAPSDIILQKISSENIIKHDADKDFDILMEKLRAQNREDPKYDGKYIKGYIQELSVKPFYVLMYTEKVYIYIYHYM